MRKIGKTPLFLVLTFGISYLMAALFYFSGEEYPSTAGMFMAMAYMFTPAFSVFVIKKLVYREEISKSLLISFKINKWFFISWMLPVFLVLLTFIISLLIPGISYSSGSEGFITRFENVLTPAQLEEMQKQFESAAIHPVWLILLQGMIAGITINAVAGFGEELGWRGFLVRQFRHMRFGKASLIIGFIWGIWHAPLILMGHNYPQHPVTGAFLMILWCILLSPMFLYITLKSQSVIAASVLHGTINATAGIALIMIAGGNDLFTGLTGLTGFIAILIVDAAFFVFDVYLSREKIMFSLVEKHLPETLHVNNK